MAEAVVFLLVFFSIFDRPLIKPSFIHKKSIKQKPRIKKKAKEPFKRRDRAHKKWQKSCTEEDRAKYLTRHS